MSSSDRPDLRLRLDLPDAVRTCVRRIEECGARVWLVGGAVRNALLGCRVDDWDLATTAAPDSLAEWFPCHVDLDLRLGRLCLAEAPGEIIVTSCREEGEYSDRRHPDRVRFATDPAVDALRRDFTVNAIYADPTSGTLVDPCGGVADLLDRPCLRTIGDPAVRLAEDPLRILRAIRFSAGYDLPLDADLRAAMVGLRALLGSLSVDRRRAELTAMFTGAGAGGALRSLVELGLVEFLLPVEVDVDDCAWRLDRLGTLDPALAWAGLLADSAAGTASDVVQGLGFGRKLRDRVVSIRQVADQLSALGSRTPHRRDQVLRHPEICNALQLARVVATASGVANLDRVSEWLQKLPEAPVEPWFSGADVIALGVPRGPSVGAVLTAAETAWERAGAVTREDAAVILGQIVRASIKAARP